MPSPLLTRRKGRGEWDTIHWERGDHVLKKIGGK